MSSRRPPPARDQVIAALRSRSEVSWDAISGTVRRRIRLTARPGRLLRITGSASVVAGDLTVRDQALRAVLARALTSGTEYVPTTIDFAIDHLQLIGVRIRLRGPDADGPRPAERARRIVMSVIREVLGDAQADLLAHTIEIELTRDGAVVEEK